MGIQNNSQPVSPLNTFVLRKGKNQKNSKRHSMRILLILPFPLYKSIQRTNRLRIFLYPHSQSIKGLTAWDLCLNTLEGTSFVVQVEGTSTWVVVTENKRGYISCGSVLVEGTSTRFKENKGGYIPCGSLLVKGFLQGWKKSQGPQVAWGLDVGTGCCRTSIKTLVCLSPSSLLFYFPLCI